MWVTHMNVHKTINVKLLYSLGKEYLALSELSGATGQFRKMPKMLGIYKVCRPIQISSIYTA